MASTKAKRKAARKEKVEEEKSLKQELAAQMLTLATSGFGLVAALAWNETIQDVVKNYIEPRIPGSGILSRLIYALLVTIMAVFVTYQLSRLAARFDIEKSSK